MGSAALSLVGAIHVFRLMVESSKRDADTRWLIEHPLELTVIMLVMSGFAVAGGLLTGHMRFSV